MAGSHNDQGKGFLDAKNPFGKPSGILDKKENSHDDALLGGNFHIIFSYNIYTRQYNFRKTKDCSRYRQILSAFQQKNGI